MASAKDVSLDGQLLGYNDFVDVTHGAQPGTGYAGRNGFESWIVNSFGLGNQYKSDYEAYKANWQNYNNAKAVDEQRRYDAMREDTAYQRMYKDLKAAGLNPWLAVQSSLGGVSTNPSSAKKYDAGDSGKKSDTGRSLALMLLATARLIAAL